MNGRARSAALFFAKVQALSGALFAVFLIAHLGNTVSALAGQRVFDALQGGIGWVVQGLLSEWPLLGCLGVHVAAGVIRNSLAPGRVEVAPSSRTSLDRAHRWVGRGLAVVVPFHVIGTRGPEWFSDVTTDMSYVTYTLDHMGLLFHPYYFILFMAGAFHMTRGLQRSAAWISPSTARWFGALSKSTALFFVLISSSLALLSLLALGGWLYDVDRSPYPAYEAYFRALGSALNGD